MAGEVSAHLSSVLNFFLKFLSLLSNQPMPANFMAPVGVASPRDGIIAAEASVRDTVLLVEDDPLLTKLFLVFIGRCGLRAVQASDSEEGLRLFTEHRGSLALVLMDCNLPDSHGGGLSHRLRALVPGIPLLLTSGRKQEVLHALLAKDGPTGFLSKPFLPGDVVRAVQALVPQATPVPEK